MHLSTKVSILLAACSVAARPSPNTTNKAIYVLSNNPENAVIGVPIKKNGLLGDAQVTLTGGVGQAGVDNEGVPSGPDSLFSQGAVAAAGEYIFAVNPVSNTLSQLKADRHNPSKLSLVGEPALLPGDFPNTVGASSKNSLVCVGTTGTRAGVTCAPFGKHGLGDFDDLRPFELNQSIPPVGASNTVSHVLFSEDETLLYTTVKGNGDPSNTGHFSVFPVKYGCSPDKAATVATEGIRTSPNGTAVLFGSVVIPSSGLVFATDPGFGAAILDVNKDTYEADLLNLVTVPDQGAICWAAYSDKTNSVLVTDVTVNRLVELDATDGAILRTTDILNSDPGLIDLLALEEIVYALSPGNGTTDAAIAVFDLEKNELVQRLSIDGVGAGPVVMGMAYLEL